jgi:hypothetical protein
MRICFLTAAFAVLLAVARNADGHGAPIKVRTNGSTLAVSGGETDDGFAPWVFFEDDDEGVALGTFSLPGVGNVVLWEVPGLDILGLDNQSSLSMEPIIRPARDTNPLQDWLVWYWNPSTASVERSTADVHLLDSTGTRFSTLDADAEAAPAPFLLANSLHGQQGFHNHGLLAYGLEFLSPTPAGAYGFFARLTSDIHGSSEPFLVVLNHGLPTGQVETAALAINAAANEGLPGDYNQNGVVDAADYVVWRDALGDANSLQVWKANFGSATSAGAGRLAVPEPDGVLLSGIAVGLLACCLVRRQ